jgi:hypothetical protein
VLGNLLSAVESIETVLTKWGVVPVERRDAVAVLLREIAACVQDIADQLERGSESAQLIEPSLRLSGHVNDLRTAVVGATEDGGTGDVVSRLQEAADSKMLMHFLIGMAGRGPLSTQIGASAEGRALYRIELERAQRAEAATALL